MNSHDIAHEMLILLVDILASAGRVLCPAGRADPRLEDIRLAAHDLERLVLDYWADEAARDSVEDPPLHLDQLLEDEPDF